MYKCKVPGCGYETDNRYGYAGHMKGHKKGGKVVKVTRAIIGAPKEPLKPEDVADALLKRVVEALTKYDDLLSEVSELRGYKKEVPKLEQELKDAKGEIERILKIHNDQVKSRKLTDAETLRKLAKL